MANESSRCTLEGLKRRHLPDVRHLVRGSRCTLEGLKQFVLFSVAEVVEQGVATVETRRETGIHIEIPEKEPG